MKHRSIHIALLAVTATAAFVAPASAQQDLRSPDAADPMTAPAPAQVDLRSPDARTPVQLNIVDRRSPDAADPYNGVPTKVVEVPTAPVQVVDGGFQWVDAGIGAAGLFALVLLAVGASSAGRRNRHRPVLG